MIKLSTVLLTLVVALAFGGMTFAGPLADNSSIQNTFPLNSDADKDDKGDKGKKGDKKKMDEKKDKDGKDGKDGKGEPKKPH
ncbi:MAG: hypothetical protein H0W49_02215 [Nitrospirales bacterium]|nr:hypothetical protein [Nitrospirales bacterium]MBA3968009.1 hypothetical protein [Nitrospirales bacterium]